jgi:hypothetical protein
LVGSNARSDGKATSKARLLGPVGILRRLDPSTVAEELSRLHSAVAVERKFADVLADLEFHLAALHFP